MDLFDSLIKETLPIINNSKVLPLTEELLEDVGKNNMVFRDEMAYELGGEFKKSLSFELITSNEDLIDKDEILLIGNDLNEIKTDTDFIRLTLIKVSNEDITGNELFERLEKIRFTKYRVSPSGYMLRTAKDNQEKVRLSKDTAHSSFSKIGSAYIKAYKQIPYVKSVKEIFITGEFKEYESLKKLAERSNNIIDTIDHILKGMTLNDCNSCSVKSLCDEVEGLRELHQKESQNNIA